LVNNGSVHTACTTLRKERKTSKDNGQANSESRHDLPEMETFICT